MILFKTKNNCVNYYKVNIYPTLFGDFLIQKEYGRSSNLKPTNIIKEYAHSNKEALLLMLDIALDKKNSGYMRSA